LRAADSTCPREVQHQHWQVHASHIAGSDRVRQVQRPRSRRAPSAEPLTQPPTPPTRELLGHADVATTMKFTHVLGRGANAVKSLLDR
jgi:hypothetical protein